MVDHGGHDAQLSARSQQFDDAGLLRPIDQRGCDDLPIAASGDGRCLVGVPAQPEDDAAVLRQQCGHRVCQQPILAGRVDQRLQGLVARQDHETLLAIGVGLALQPASRTGHGRASPANLRQR
jgi:hypothetical protein